MSSQAVVEEAPPALPPRSAQRDSCGSPQISPVQPVHPATAAPSSPAQAAPPVPEKPATTQPTQQSTQAQQVQGLFPNTVVPTETIKTRREELREGDRHWQWKIAFRAAVIIVGLIGTGCAAWIVAHFTAGTDEFSYAYYFDDAWTIPWTLITFVLSIVWSASCVITFFTRKPTAPVHPGAQVGVDLVLWLGFLTTGLFAIFGTISVASWGSDGTLGYFGSGSGHYVQGSNGTWTWQTSQSDSYYYEDRPCNSSSSSSRYQSSFDSCEEQDAFVNAMWKGNVMRYNIDLTVTVCQFLALLFHFILFVWACVDTHRRNSRSVSKDAEKLAAEIVMNMVKNGAIIPAPGQAHFRPTMPMAQQAAPMGFVYPQQQYPQQYQQYPQQYAAQQYPTTVAQGKAPMPQPAVALSSNEKSAGPRYA
ncbi:hypothetical protein GRF29_44g652830 [Pseudopithomyces chartarum]|uniref:Uncharacterized protein n=1 Tax=Pseudopithomyces chartarum TaxID=1892770 RepID=A0AAN6RHR3_9PLEO|nr:hypothetical protein GRF29_44g652830 [Pseudopithomyces chartarum]